MKEQVYCRWAPSLGELEGTAEKVWGTIPYDVRFPDDGKASPCVFFGLYGFRDFQTLWNHRGKRWILWAGSDIRHLKNGYWLDVSGKIRLDPEPIARWINKNCESWCENVAEQEALAELGIDAQICPSFLGDVNQYKVQFVPSDTPRVYASVSGDDFILYKWEKIGALARKNPNIEFHLYGNTKAWTPRSKNVIVHGRVPKEQMNAEIQHMQGGLRLLDFDGFSEILAKSVLWGQWPISAIPYPHMLGVDDIKSLPHMKEPNYAGREYYLKAINKFPWV